MKLFAKMFASVMAILCLSLAVAGYLLISASFDDSLESKKEQALSQYQMTEFVLKAKLAQDGENRLTEPEFFDEMKETSNQFIQSVDLMAIMAQGETVYNSFPSGYLLNFASEREGIHLEYNLEEVNGRYLLTVAGYFSQDDQTIFLITGSYINEVMEQRNRLTESYGMIYLIVCVIGAALALVLSAAFVRPINQMSKSAAQIAGGDYSARVLVRTKDEIGKLGNNFNQMAEAVEESMEHLRQEVISKEDFVANFAHELKTPLTSVVGYADMICGRSLSEKEIKKAAQYIRDEGMRLEELSLKLMDLTVLNKQTFLLEELSAKEVLAHAAALLKPVFEKKGIELQFSAEDAYIRVEFDLFETLLINLMDNAVKADASIVYLDGRRWEGSYRIMVNDNGRGIPKNELGRITEAFYMVDKSRSRKQHGAGLGLALAAKIAKVHQAKLQFNSRIGIGTKVAVTLPCAEDE